QNRPQGIRERQVDIGVNLYLNQAVDVVLDRILGGDDLLGDVVQLVECRIKGGRLARAGRPRDEHDAVRLVNQFAERIEDVRLHAEAVEIETDRTAIEHPQYRCLTEHDGQDADAQVHLVAADIQLDAAVLRQAALGDVEIGHDLDAGRDRGGQMARGRH